MHSPDRLAQKYAYQVLLVDEFRRAGVEVIFLNRALGHSRTAYVDYPEPNRRRHLVRLWMRDHGRRAYPG